MDRSITPRRTTPLSEVEYQKLSNRLSPLAGMVPLITADQLPLATPTDTSLDRVRREFTRLPQQGTPAVELTDRDRLALAVAVGVPTEFQMDGVMLTLRSKVPFAVADRPGGGYIIARHA